MEVTNVQNGVITPPYRHGECASYLIGMIVIQYCYSYRHSCHETRSCRPQSYMYWIIGSYVIQRKHTPLGGHIRLIRYNWNVKKKLTWLTVSWWWVRRRGVTGFGWVGIATPWCCCCCSTISWWWWWRLSSFNLAVSDWWCLSASQSLLTSQQVNTDFLNCEKISRLEQCGIFCLRAPPLFVSKLLNMI